MGDSDRLRILHCFREPAGGVFRHVRDLAVEHARAGHDVGFLCDSATGGPFEEALLESVRPHLSLGATRLSIPRPVGPGDIAVLRNAMPKMRALAPTIVHGHGAKGGVLARLAGTLLARKGDRPARLYSPHGGSLHHSATSLSGRLYFGAERLLERCSDALIFVSDYEQRTYAAKIGRPRTASYLVYNGVSAEEFAPVALAADCADFLFVGTMRDLKGPDVFIEAMALVSGRAGRPVSGVMVGDGPERDRYRAMIEERGLAGRISMRPAMTAREAFAFGRIMCVPSRAEAMPYIVLEALAAGKPVIASRVGGIPEVFGAECPALVPPGEAASLARVMIRAIEEPDWPAHAMPDGEAFRTRFSAEAMAGSVLAVYRACRNGTAPEALPAHLSNVS